MAKRPAPPPKKQPPAGLSALTPDTPSGFLDVTRRRQRRVVVWDRVPLFLYFTGISGLAMIPVAMLAGTNEDFTTARPFFYGSVLVLTLTVMVALAMHNRPSRMIVRQQLLALLGAFTLLPVILAWPLKETVPDLRFIDAYMEMVSSITTTGMTLEPEPLAWPRGVHLWRAEVGWLGGLLIWVAAIAILAPLRIGGFELLLPRKEDLRQEARLLGARELSPQRRVSRAFFSLVGIYTGLTFALFMLLMVAGEEPFIALCHAMSTLSTSGISPVGGLENGSGGVAAEMVLFAFFIFALTRRSFSTDLPGLGRKRLWQDPEIRVAFAAVFLVTVVLFVRHWYALVETAEIVGITLIPRAIWGAIFTTMSFLTTTGFVSGQWEIARLWSGLSTSGMVLMGLALIGGGVATAAGGVKLLRIYVLYKHGQREVSRLIHPSTVGGIGTRRRPVSMDVAYMAWLFFMLVALSITLTMVAMTLTGQSFETATILTLAAISNTGPLVDVASVVPLDLETLSGPAKMILCAAMGFGRLETLAIIALLNPDFWRA